jgi:hypothetical protein
MWFSPENLLTRDEAITLARGMPEDDWVFLHAAQTIAAYPFFRSVVHSAGRSIRFGDGCSLADSTRKAYEQYGERESVHRCVRYVYHTLLDWGVLKKSMKRGSFSKGRTWKPKTRQSIDYLARVCAGGRASLYWSEFAKDPAFFFVQIGDEPNQKQRQAFERHGDDYLIQFSQGECVWVVSQALEVPGDVGIEIAFPGQAQPLFASHVERIMIAKMLTNSDPRSPELFDLNPDIDAFLVELKEAFNVEVNPWG